jgi:glycosyltransferase involved in cell wall biosynthesis
MDPLRPSIALLIPAFNAAQYLPRLLESANQQTDKFDEIWLYDDCSTDETSIVAETWGVQVVRGDVNRGCSHGKNVLAAQTGADWIHFHDADDELKPNFVALARRWASEGRFDVILFNYEIREDSTGGYIGLREFNKLDLARGACSYAIRNQINPFCGLYKRDRFLSAGGYDEDPLVLYNEDVAMHIGLAFAGLSFAVESELALTNHIMRNSMSSANRLKCLQAQYHVMRKIAEKENTSAYVADISGRLWRIVEGLAAHLDWQTADQAVSLAVALSALEALPEGRLFRLLCASSPHAAIRIREWLTRIIKPQLRVGFPSLHHQSKLFPGTI